MSSYAGSSNTRKFKQAFKAVGNFFIRPYVLGYLCFFFALALLRQSVAAHIGTAKAQAEGYYLGLYYDAIIGLLPFVAAYPLRRVFPKLVKFKLLVLLLVFWLATLACNLYFIFFHSKLFWWMVKVHYSDVPDLLGSIENLSSSWQSAVSFGLLALSFVLVIQGTQGLKDYRLASEKKISYRKRFLIDSGIALGAFLVVLLLQQQPLKFKREIVKALGSNADLFYVKPAISDHFVTIWLPEMTWRKSYIEQGSFRLEHLNKAEIKNPSAVLQAFAEKSPNIIDSLLDKPWAQYREEPIDRKLAAQWRKALGFSEKQKINIIVMFLETGRAFELLHPVMGPRIFPNLTKEISANSNIFFSQVYSSGLTAGQTARGRFSTFCSQLPNMLGITPPLANTKLRADCVQEHLRDWGFERLWLTPALQSFHNCGEFELNHGGNIILDREILDPEAKHRFSSIGLDDHLMFAKVLETAEKYHSKDRPFFMHAINSETHFNWRLVDEPAYPEGNDFTLLYRSYVSELHKWDKGFADFLKKFRASPIAEDTLLVLSGDHGATVKPGNLIQNDYQLTEVSLRIPVMFFSKHIKKGVRIDHPVAQMDLAPTFVHILAPAEVPSYKTSFQGLPMAPVNQPQGSWITFVGEAGNRFYRTRTSACYTKLASREYECFDSAGQDPLFAKMNTVPVDSAMSVFFEKVAEANIVAIERDGAFRPKDSPRAR